MRINEDNELEGVEKSKVKEGYDLMDDVTAGAPSKSIEVEEKEEESAPTEAKDDWDSLSLKELRKLYGPIKDDRQEKFAVFIVAREKAKELRELIKEKEKK